MADNFNSVPLGRAGTGAAVVFDQNIATRPTSIWQQQNKFNAAQKAAEERAKALRAKELESKLKELWTDPEKVISEAEPEARKRYQNLMDVTATKLKTAKERGALSIEDESEIRRLRSDYKSYADKTTQMATELKDMQASFKGNKAFNYENVATTAAGYLKDATVDPSKFDKQQLNDLILNDPKNYDISFLGEEFKKGLATQMVEKHGRNGRLDEFTVEKFKLDVERNPDGSIAYEEGTSLPKIKITPGTAFAAQQHPDLSRALNAMKKQDEANGINKPFETYLADALRSKAEVDKDTQRIARPQPRVAAPKEQPFASTQLSVPGSTPVATRSASGKQVVSSNTFSPAARVAVKKNQEPYSGVITPATFIEVNGDNGETRMIANNRNPLKVTYGATQLHLASPTGNILPTPSNIQTNEQFLVWAKEQVQRKGYEKFKVEPFATGTAEDKANVDFDYAQAEKEVKKELGSKADEIAPTEFNALVEQFQNRNKETSKVRQTNRSVLVPLKGLTREFVRAQTDGLLLPDKVMQDEQVRINSELDKIRGKKSTKPTTPSFNPAPVAPAKTTPKKKAPSFNPTVAKR